MPLLAGLKNSKEMKESGLEPKDQAIALCGGERWKVVRMQTWVVASPDSTILRPRERTWLGETLGVDLSQPSPCFVRKSMTTEGLTTANFVEKCHAKEDPEAGPYILVTVTELETGRKIATRTIMADHDNMFSSMYELTTEQVSPAVVDLKMRSNPDVRCDGASRASTSAFAMDSARLGFADVEMEREERENFISATAKIERRSLLGSGGGSSRVSTPPPPGKAMYNCFAGFRAESNMGLAFGGEASKSFSSQKNIAAFHIDKIFEKASCNGWGDAFAFGDSDTANFDDARRRELLCGKTADVPILQFEAFIFRLENTISNVLNDEWQWLGEALGGTDMSSRREFYS